MRFKQVSPQPVRQKYRLYSPTALTNAYRRVKEDNMSVRRASIQYSVPMQTLRDRVLGKIPPETVAAGRVPVLSLDEEERIVNHLKTVASLGYGYTRQEVVDLASDFAVQVRKRTVNNPFTLNWFNKFIKRWPELRVIKPRGLEQCRAQSASVPVVSKYFVELEKILEKYLLKDKPHLIFNIDEKGITQYHTPPAVVSGNEIHPSAVTAGKSTTTTIIGCGSASGMAVPPYYVFAGKMMIPDLMKGALPGASCSMSDSGWSNSDIFRRYLSDHFLKFVPTRTDQHILLLLDGHKSHVSIGLVEWAHCHNIILFILPAHTSHVLQPMDVGCYGPFQRMYNAECHKFTRQSSCTVTRYDVCELSSKVYYRALSAENLQSAFQKTGIFPFNPSVISRDVLKPAEVFSLESDQGESDADDDSQKTVEGGIVMHESDTTDVDMREEVPEVAGTSANHPILEKFFTSRVNTLKSIKKEGVRKRKPRRTMSAIVSGKAITEEDVEVRMLKHQEQGSSKMSLAAKSVKGKFKAPKRSTDKRSENSKKKSVEISKSTDTFDSSTSESDEDDPSELCCVCGHRKPKALENIYVLFFAKWAQCDGVRDGIPCKHWVHIPHCSNVKTVRRHSEFLCPHCVIQAPNSEE